MYDQDTFNPMQQHEQKMDKHQKSVQDIVGDNLFAQIAHISDIKQIVAEMQNKAQNLQQKQMQAIFLLLEMQENTYLHGENKPYQKFIDKTLKEFILNAADPNYYLNLINELVPKPPKPIIVLPSGKAVQEVKR